jgi:hypothetical protein
MDSELIDESMNRSVSQVLKKKMDGNVCFTYFYLSFFGNFMDFFRCMYFIFFILSKILTQ